MISRRRFIAGGAAFVAALVLGGAKPPHPVHPPRPRPTPTPVAGGAFAAWAFSPGFQI